jgi:hypothetical protein
MTRHRLEKSFQASVVELARLLGWRAFYVTDSRGSPPGWPDLTLCRDGVLLFRELKAEKGRLSLEQQEWRDLLLAAGMDWALWRPSDWPRIEAELKGQLPIEVAS